MTEFDFQPSVANFAGYSGWSCTSDRNAKENFLPVDGRQVLRQLVAMPISTWNYKGADPKLRMLGPTAQDFLAAFGPGQSETTIATGNEEGVALAAIQGLHQVVQEKDAKIEAQQRRIDELEARMGHIESLRSELDTVKRTLSRLVGGEGRVAMRETP